MIDSTWFMEWQWMCSSIGVLCYGVRNGVWLEERRSGAGTMGVGRGCGGLGVVVIGVSGTGRLRITSHED